MRFVGSATSSHEPRVPTGMRIYVLCLLWTQFCAAFVVRSRPSFSCFGRTRSSEDDEAVIVVASSLLKASSRPSPPPRRCRRTSVTAATVAAACPTALQEGRHHQSASPRESTSSWKVATAADRRRGDECDALMFQQLCHEAGVVPNDILRLDTSFKTDESSDPSSKEEEGATTTAEFDGRGGVRGVYLNRGVRAGDVIVSIPLLSCLRDDNPPLWYDCAAVSAESPDPLGQHDDADEATRPCMIAGSYNPSDWATRLAASLLHEQLSRQRLFRGRTHHPNDHATNAKSTDLWLQLLPDPDWLRASLPTHWPASVLQSACCASLELAVDAMYFSRAQAAQDLMDALLSRRSSPWGAVLLETTTSEQLRRMCHDALDVIQTRSCRVSVDLCSEGGVNPATAAREVATPLRLLAPVFDMINHSNRPNAEFFVQYGEGDDATTSSEDGRLVVRAVRDLRPDDQVLIDYGASTRPAYRCLASYGFVPAHPKGENVDAEDEEQEDDDVAEVYIDGSRYEVTRTTVPEDIVLAMTASPTSSAFVGTGYAITEAETAQLTPDIAIKLATRLSDVAYQLLLNPLHFVDEGDAGAVDENDDDNDESGAAMELPHDVHSARLAAELRWNQHRILLACALGLRDWAVRGSSR